MGQLTIGALAKEADVNLQTIRYYEREGLLPEPPRRPSGYRMFSNEDVQRVRFIKSAQELGFSLKEIKELLALRVDANTSCAEVRERAKAKIADVEDKLRTLQAMKQALIRLTATCTGQGPVADCPILESIDLEGYMQ